MKIYFIYLLPKNILYAITDNNKYMKRFMSERNSKRFKVIKKKADINDIETIMSENKKIILSKIPLESSSGDYTIIGTNNESYIIDCICENIVDNCFRFKLHFTENFSFNNEYIEVLDALTNISKNINDHPIIQIDSMKLFYYLFKETFINIDEDEVVGEYDEYIQKFINQYKLNI